MRSIHYSFHLMEMVLGLASYQSPAVLNHPPAVNCSWGNGDGEKEVNLCNGFVAGVEREKVM